MSSFMVEDKTINRILTFLFWKGKTIYFDSELEKLGITEEEHFNKLGGLMKALNRYAFNYRYNENNNLKQELSFKWIEEETDIFQVLKSVSCLVYQCSEGNTEKKNLFKFLVKLENALKDKIIDDLPEYKKAEWN